MSGVKLPKFKKKSITKKVGTIPMPKYVYIPLINGNDDNITMLVKLGDKVKKGTVIGRTKGDFKIPIHSSVSGTLVKYEEHIYLNGKKVKCAMIENDFKETLGYKKTNIKDISEFTKKEFINIIRDSGIVGLGGSGFPTYVKYDTDKKINTLIVNAVECEPYITSDFMTIKEHIDEILETIEAIIKINNIDEAIIAVKKDDSKLQKLINDNIGTYLNIKMSLVNSNYPAGWEKSIIKEVKKVTYDYLPIEKGIVVNNISTIYAMYEALKYNKPLIERIVTITGPAVKKPQNVFVKVGYPINVVIEMIGGYKKLSDLTIVAGGPMMGVSLASDDLVVSRNLNCVLVLPETEFSAIECLRCGNCITYCPVKLCPILIKDNALNKDNLIKLHPEKCIECGICSFVCPSRIAIREIVKQAKKKIREDK